MRPHVVAEAVAEYAAAYAADDRTKGQIVRAIPQLTSDNVAEYVSAVNHAVLHHAISAATARTMLYGAQLVLSATPPAAQPPRNLSGSSRTIDA